MLTFVLLVGGLQPVNPVLCAAICIEGLKELCATQNSIGKKAPICSYVAVLICA
jgi:hypothetical protein